MDWADVPAVMDEWVEKVGETAQALKPLAAGISTDGAIGFYRTAEAPEIALYGEGASDRDFLFCKRAASAVGPLRAAPLTLDELSSPEGGWIKVAYSHGLRRAGELLNFFPGQYPGGIPNAPSPLAAMLTTGLVGAGLGYGAGRVVGGLLPERFGRKLRRAGAVTGGALAALPASAWAVANHANDHSILDAWPLDEPPTSEADFSDLLKQSAEMFPEIPCGRLMKQAIDDMLDEGEEKIASNFSTLAPNALEVNINEVGHTLWDLGASEDLVGTTLGALYAAQQLPDPRRRVGVVTGSQLGRLAANAAGDYMDGLLLGAALNVVVGTPIPATTFGAANATLGVLSDIVPKLFGR